MSVMYIRNEQTGKFDHVPSLVGPQGPKGEHGSIESLTINGKSPDSSGAVTLTPEDLGAASAEEASQLKDDLTAEQTARANADQALANNISDAWASGKTYAVGDYCISGNRLYKCKTAHTAGSAFDAEYWDEASVSAEISSVRSTVESKYAIGPGLEIATGSTQNWKSIIFNLRDNYRSGFAFIIGSSFLATIYIHKNGTYTQRCDNSDVTITKLSTTSFAVTAGTWARFYAICQQNNFEITYGD